MAFPFLNNCKSIKRDCLEKKKKKKIIIIIMIVAIIKSV